MAGEYLPPGQRVVMAMALSLGTFIQVLDTSIANVSIPTIAGDLGVSPDQGTWVITSFSVSNAIVLPLTGWLASQIGMVRLFCLSTFLFGLTSWLCGSAPNLFMLIVFRVLQGAAGGCLIPLSQALLLTHHPKEQHPRALAIWSMVVVVAPVAGPVLGGWITQDYGWAWIFYINVPIALLSCFLVWTLLKDRESPVHKETLDWFGLFLLTLAVSTLQVALDKGNQWDWFNSNLVNTLLLTTLVSGTLFYIWNQGAEKPIINFKFFKDRNFAIGVFLITLGFLLYFSGTVVLPLWLQDYMGYTPLWAGIAVMPVGILPVFLSFYVSYCMQRYDLRILIIFAFIVFGVTNYLFSLLYSQISVQYILSVRLWQGLGLAFFFLPLVQVSLLKIKKEDLAGASGLFHFVRILVGSGIGTSLSITFFSRHIQRFHADIGEHLSLGRPEVQNYFAFLKNLHIPFEKAKALLDQTLNQEAAVLAFDNYLWLSAVLFFVSIPLVLLCRTK